MKVKIGFQLVPQHGEYRRMRERWMEAEALGVDGLYSADHFFALAVTEKILDGSYAEATSAPNFEGMSLQAAMAATTTRPEIGCLVHAIGFRNPQLLADMARTIDHICGGRFVLGIGAGYQERDYVEYGYAYGTQQSRLRDLARDLPLVRARLRKLNPPPPRKLPILIASMGERIGMRIVAEHADRWHVYGSLDKIAHKIEVLKRICREIGRDFSEIELTTWYSPDLLAEKVDPGEYLKLGIANLVVPQLGPDWDLGPVRELLAWRRALG